MKLSLRSLLLMSIFLLPGCGGGVKDWIHGTFDQGKQYRQERALLDQHLRSVKIYDQFTTVAMFDVLWLSDQIRTLYANTHAAMHGRSDEIRKTFLRRQLKANAHYVSFYVLSTHEIPLNLKPAQWVMYLRVGEKTYTPFEVKSVELVPEYESFFGKLLTNHKRPYEVKFDRKDIDGRDILEGAATMALYFSGPRHYTSAHWDLKERKDEK